MDRVQISFRISGIQCENTNAISLKESTPAEWVTDSRNCVSVHANHWDGVGGRGGEGVTSHHCSLRVDQPDAAAMQPSAISVAGEPETDAIKSNGLKTKGLDIQYKDNKKTTTQTQKVLELEIKRKKKRHHKNTRKKRVLPRQT
ncbi:hypothetical protein RR46_01274 [Papilio xuthus]|uniref:Uncharacterized protein n=1 Tax=Papilio xuthus TaxID=66420 RepID=A0A0N1PEM0_PAPXU|nr:hypothetical protein RR46_01274 [Papilio xuthus]